MLIGDLDLNAAPAVAALNQVDRKFSGTTSALASMAGRLGPLIAGFVTFGAVMNGFKEAMDLGGELSDISARTGESAGDLVILRQAFDNAGVGAEKVQPSLLKLQDAIAGMNEEGKSTAGALKLLGISAAELRNLSGIEQLERIGAGMRELDQTTRVAVARDLFGKAGGDALSVLTDPEAFATARAQAGALADVMDRNAASFDSLGDVVGAAKLNLNEFFAGALSKIAPEAENIAQAFEQIDFVKIGESVAEVAKGIEVLVAPLIALSDAAKSLADLTMGSEIPALSAFDKEGVARRRGLTGGGSGENRSGLQKESPISGLQRIGGGGGGFGVDPLLSESQRQTRLLERIAANTVATGGGRSSSTAEKVPV